MITIVDCGIGNLGSIRNMLKKIGVHANVATTPDTVAAAEKLILPGIGAFDHGMRHINESGMRDVMEHRVIRDRVPVLGICLGMQLLTNGSEEGHISGLGWIDATTRRFNSEQLGNGFPIPHMGWNLVSSVRSSPLFHDLREPRFYFVHSYYVECANKADSVATTEYGCEFTSAVTAGNVYGVQFHPEKSHRFGMQLLRNFTALPA